MSSILDLEVFVRTADTGSLSAAARSLSLTPAAASIALKRLETPPGYTAAGALHPQHAPDRGRPALPGQCARGAGSLV